MALRPIQLCIVFTIGFHLATAATQDRRAIRNQVTISIELQDPKDVIVAKGQSASLACAIQATVGNVDLVWIYNGSKIPLNDTRWELLDNGTLYIPKVTGKRMNSLEGLYQCLVKNNVGSLLSSAAKLSVATLGKEFQEQPVNITIQEGQPALLPCKIHSFPSGGVLWVQNNLTLPQTARYVPLPSGALLITSSHSSDTGSYRCNVINPILKNKARESDVGWLTVTPLPPRASDFFPTPPVLLPLGLRLNTTALVGENVNLYCAADGRPLPSLHWIKGPSSAPLGNSSVLTLRNVTAESTGKYTCIAKNRLGIVNQTFYVEIYQPPYFNNTLESKIYVTPVTLRIPCNAFGIPKPKVYWLKNGEKMIYNVRQRNHSDTLIISNSITQDMGFYQCIAENPAGRTWIAAQYVPRDLIPDILPPFNVKCRPYNETSFCVYWEPTENVTLTAYVVYYYHAESKTEHLKVTNLTYLMLENLNRSTNYTFYVRAFTMKVSDQSEKIVCKTGIIGKRNLEVRLHNESAVELNWSRISTDTSCDGSSSDYRVQWKRANQTYNNVEYVKQSSYYICDLESTIQYQFRVTASSVKNENSPWVNFAMPEYLKNATAEPPKPTNREPFNTAPFNLKSEYISSSSINLSWTHYDKDNNTDSFSICHLELNSNKNCQTTPSKLNRFSFENLQPSTTYEFKVRAKYSNGSFGLYSGIIEVCTLPEVLGPPTIQDLKYRILNASSICLRWRAPHTINGTRIKYVLSYKNPKDDVVEKKIDINTSQHCWIPPPFGDDVFQAQLTQLNPEIRYTVSISLQNSSNIYSIVVSTRKMNNTAEKDVDEIYEQQKLGFILGIAISLCGVISCIACLGYSMKRKHSSNALPPTRANYYNGGTNTATAFGSLQIIHHETCIADAQEVETLIGENGMCHIPSVTPNDLDTKGGIDFPNRQANGTLHHSNKTAYIPNGHVHITENPQFYINSQNQNKHPESEPMLPPAQDSYEEDSNSNLQNTKMRKFYIQTPADRSENRISGSSMNESVDSSMDSSLNATQLTNLDISGVIYRKVSAPLGPNG